MLLATVSLAQTPSPTMLFGLTLGEPWPANMPRCSPGIGKQTSLPCRNEYGGLRGAPYDSGIVLVTTDDDSLSRTESSRCPLCKAGRGRIQELQVNIPAQICQESIDNLKAKFGAPSSVEQVEMANGFGAHWTESEYSWDRSNSDRVRLVDKADRINCFLEATTKQWRDRPDNQSGAVKF
jgi:hypothetical protein